MTNDERNSKYSIGNYWLVVHDQRAPHLWRCAHGASDMKTARLGARFLCVWNDIDNTRLDKFYIHWKYQLFSFSFIFLRLFYLFTFRHCYVSPVFDILQYCSIDRKSQCISTGLEQQLVIVQMITESESLNYCLFDRIQIQFKNGLSANNSYIKCLLRCRSGNHIHMTSKDRQFPDD